MAKQAPRTPKATTPAASAIAQVAAQAVTQAPQPVQAVKTARTGTVAVVVVGAKPYRTTAAHNVAWWQAITKALAAGPQPVAALCALPTDHGVVPGHFVAYGLRKGYLAAGQVA